ncbi:MAG: hypothetical protein J5798_14185, partial [Spirochaetaceae bacterium]|nr:hypothetical protein [Spirochaetaceae bacterium]
MADESGAWGKNTLLYNKQRVARYNIINLRHFLKSKKKDRIFPGGEMRKFLNIRQENGYQRIYER